MTFCRECFTLYKSFLWPFYRENQSRFLPPHVAKSSSWSWLPVSRKTSAEVRLLEQFKRVPTTATTRKLMRKYLEFCWALPFYGWVIFSILPVPFFLVFWLENNFPLGFSQGALRKINCEEWNDREIPLRCNWFSSHFTFLSKLLILIGNIFRIICWLFAMYLLLPVLPFSTAKWNNQFEVLWV